MSPPPPTATIGGFPTVVASRRRLAEIMVADCLSARQEASWQTPKLVFSSNGQGISLAGRDAEFNDIMQQADLIHADGMPVVFASKLTSTPLPERISTTDFFHDAARAAVKHDLSFYFLGAREDQNAAAVSAAKLLYPGLKVVGRHHGYFDEGDDREICRRIRDARPDVLWVALGKPRQEYWCARNRSRLEGIGWIKTCGGLYSFLAGDAPRAPQWAQAAGMEWFFRVLDDPKRLAWRYMSTNPHALYRLLRYTDRRARR
jgi:N-acetylglucosaminyldiphosphoundecaprenol N-acetyl-beta-D-mannosaminyltransferase